MNSRKDGRRGRKKEKKEHTEKPEGEKNMNRNKGMHQQTTFSLPFDKPTL